MSAIRGWAKMLPLGIGAAVILGAGAVGLLRHARSGEGRPPSPPAGAEADPESPAPTDFRPARAERPSSEDPPPPEERTPSSSVIRTSGNRPPAGLEAQVIAIRKTVLDEQVDPALRIRELQSLQQLRGLTPKVTERMLKLLPKLEDDRLRGKIIRGLDGDRSDSFKFEILSRLAHDPSALVRKAAAEGLRPFREDPLVVRALENARQSDPDPWVRRESEQSLTGPLPSAGAGAQKPAEGK